MAYKIRDIPLILLAGGRSSRMGTPKGLLDYQGSPWLVEQLKRFNAASGRQAIIVKSGPLYHPGLFLLDDDPSRFIDPRTGKTKWAGTIPSKKMIAVEQALKAVLVIL